jgi:hypothetical protein
MIIRRRSRFRCTTSKPASGHLQLCLVSWRNINKNNNAKNEITRPAPSSSTALVPVMFCGLVVGNRVVAVGTSSVSPGARMKGGHRCVVQSITRHAEMDVLRYLRRHCVRKARIVVVRMNSRRGRKQQHFGVSRPCLHCLQRITRYHAEQITKVTFLDEHGSWRTESPVSCLESSKLSSLERRLRGSKKE